MTTGLVINHVTRPVIIVPGVSSPEGKNMKYFASLALAAALLAAPGVASAGGSQVEDRAAAIQLCRTQVAAQSGADEADVRLDNVRVRASRVRVDLDLWRNGQLQNIRCDVLRTGDELTVASITPPLQTASAQ